MEKQKRWKKGRTIGLVVLLLGFIAFLLRAYFNGKFSSADTFRDYIQGFGIFAPFVLTLFQAMQVVVPVVPGFLGCAAGAVLFGCMGGFWCNYIGISIGSVIAFFLARKYGVSFVKMLFPGERYDKWATWLGKSRSLALMLFIAVLLPLFPDDYLCYFSGLTTMSARKFCLLIILGKPWCILAYSLIFSGIM